MLCLEEIGFMPFLRELAWSERKRIDRNLNLSRWHHFPHWHPLHINILSITRCFFPSYTYTHRIPFYIQQIFPPRLFIPPSFTNMGARVRPTPMSICRRQCKYKLSVISLLFTNFYWPTSSPLIYAFINYFPSAGTYIYWELKERFVKRISAHDSKHYPTSP